MPESLVWWLDEDGRERVERATPDLRSESFDLARMARNPKAYPGMENRHGRYWFASSGQHVWHESLFEATALLWLDFGGDVRSIASQPMKFVFGSGAEHFPDFFALLRSGEQVLIDVRPRKLITKAVQAQFDSTADVCAAVGWTYRILSVFDPVETANLKWIAGYRHPRNRPDALTLRKIVDEFEAPRRLWAGAAFVAGTDRRRQDVLPLIYHLMWSRVLDFNPSLPLAPSTRLWQWTR